MAGNATPAPHPWLRYDGIVRPECALCLRTTTLCLSHVAPKFLLRWMRRRTHASTFRDTSNVNVPLQDLPKLPLLCHDCEQRFSKLESAVARHFLRVLLDEDRQIVEYGPELHRCIVSIAWRMLVVYRRIPVDLDAQRAVPPRLVTAVDDVLERWRLYLLGAPSHGAEPLYVVTLDDRHGPLHGRLTNFQLEGVVTMAPIRVEGGTPFLYIRLMRFVFLVSLGAPLLWVPDNRVIHPGGGFYERSFDVPAPVERLVLASVNELLERTRGMSRQQLKKLLDEAEAKGLHKLFGHDEPLSLADLERLGFGSADGDDPE